MRVALACLHLTAVCTLKAAPAIEWIDHGTHRSSKITLNSNTPAGFTVIPPADSGIEFQNRLSNQRSLERRGLLSGSGIAAGDVDGDGWVDLYFCGLDSPNRLYRNNGNWSFSEIKPTGGIDCANTDSTGAALADIDGDSDLDLLVTASGNGTRLFLNQGDATFVETTTAAGLRSTLGSMSMALADIDGDRDLDLYVANFRPTTIMDESTTRFSGRNINGVPTVTHVNGQPTSLPVYTNRFTISPTKKILELGQVDQLFLNDGAGKFTERGFTSGHFFDEQGNPLTEPPRDWGLAVQMRDFTGDGAPDIYVCNDLYTPDRIWINRGDGTFSALPELALRNTSTFSMGVDFADIDRDGDSDFFVVDMLSPDHQNYHTQLNMTPPAANGVGLNQNRQQILRNTLQLNLGDNTYAEISQLSGVAATDWSWGPIFLDVDLDGYEDILVTNGQHRDFQNIDHAMRLESQRQGRGLSQSQFQQLINSYPPLQTPNFAFRNRGDLTFENVSSAWGFDQSGISQGMALADLDNDGDLDVIQNNLNAAATLLRNNTTAPRIRVQLSGLAPNTAGIGAKIEIASASFQQSQQILAAGRYLSSDQAARTFAANPSTEPYQLTIRWRSGKVTTIRDVRPNTLYEVNEAEAAQTPSTPSEPTGQEGIQFTDLSQDLNHTHQEAAFDDMLRQPLLPRRFSQPGPGLAWIDLDGDSWEELVIGSGRGGRLAILSNDQGHLTPASRLNKNIPKSRRDITSVLAWPSRPSGMLIAHSNYEDGTPSGEAVSILNGQTGELETLLTATESSIGVMATSDLDQDGDLDLFVGGRIRPGRYPQPADSFLYENIDGRLKLKHTFPALGMVTAAVFTDLDNDGKQELVLTREWDSLAVFSLTKFAPQDVTATWKIDQLRGWWNGLATGDFNNDGRMDLVATNWGNNHKYNLAHDRRLRIYYGDFNRDGIHDIVESYTDSETNTELPLRSLRTVGFALPQVRQRMRTFERYAKSKLQEIYGSLLDNAPSLTANHLAHTLYLNQGDHFVAHPLPRLAQLAPAFGIAVADFDSDGIEDLFLAQNFFATNRGTHRYDAGRGLLLRGNGDGSFQSVPHTESGIAIYGEQRAAAVADFDHDGRPDLAVSQNGSATKLFRNNSTERSLRIRLQGSPPNPHAVGAQMRIVGDKQSSPLREIVLATGWLTAPASTQLMAMGEGQNTLHIRWPNGSETKTKIPATATEITIKASGEIFP